MEKGEIDGKILAFQYKAADTVEDFLRRSAEKGIIRNMDYDIIAAALAGSPQHLAIHLILMGGKTDIEKFATALTDMVVNGMKR